MILARAIYLVEESLMNNSWSSRSTVGSLSEPVKHQLRIALAVYLLGFVIHTSDHERRGIAAVPEGVVWIGTAGSMLVAVIATVVLTNHRNATWIAGFGGLAHGVGVAMSHLLPKWGPFSDPLPGGNVDLATWIAVFGEIAGALLLGFGGLRSIRQEARKK
jgi:hypothetical protein